MSTDFVRLLALVSMLAASIPVFLFLSVFQPPVKFLLVAFWFFTVASDLYSTYGFYREDPSRFGEVERNKIFAFFVENLGFKKASVAFVLAVEVPKIFLFAFLLLQVVYAYMFGELMADPLACLAASFGMAAVGHLQATLQNLRGLKIRANLKNR
ncbi:MAG: hypothetical protein JRC93_13545 [Deltaproteobacteria bacterium]|nr:hypothetical protein [Deltaproteobacteria bacterium]